MKGGERLLTKQVPLDDLVLDRTVDPADDLSSLTKHIREHGLQVPILVNQDLLVIDGYRRLEALRRLGYGEEVTVASTQDYIEACQHLQRAVDHGVEAAPLTYQRIWYLYRNIRPMRDQGLSRLQKGRQRWQGTPGSEAGMKAYFQDVVKVSDSVLGAIIYTFRAAEGLSRVHEPEFVKTVIQEMVEQKKTIHWAAGKLRMPRDRTSVVSRVIVDANEQRLALRGINTSMAAITHGTNKFGPLNPGLSTGEVQQYLRDLRTMRRDLFRFIHQLEKELHEREQH
jgi:hypothetical protein